MRWPDAAARPGIGPGAWRLQRAVTYHAWPLLRLAAAAHRRRLSGTRVAVVVGSLGKTTTARAVAAALGLQPPDPYACNQFGFLALRLLAVGRDMERAVLEVGLSAPGQMAGYARLLRPHVVVVTAVASEHGRSFGSLEATRAEKARMVAALPGDGLAVLNADDANVRWMAGCTRARVVTYGESPGADVRIVARRPAGVASEMELHADGRTMHLRTRLLGRPGAHAAAAAVAVALAEGVRGDEAAARLSRLEPAEGRLQAVALAGGAVVVRDDFKSPEEGVREALGLLAQVPAARRIALLGDVTEPQPQGRVYRALGAEAARVADRLVLVGHARQRWASAAGAAGLERSAISSCGSVEAAAGVLAQELTEGDVLLVSGRQVQRLGRVVQALAGAPVRCWVPNCAVRNLPCVRCPRLLRGGRGSART